VLVLEQITVFLMRGFKLKKIRILRRIKKIRISGNAKR